jgi:hypothetical protein
VNWTEPIIASHLFDRVTHNDRTPLLKKISNLPFIIHRHMQIPRRDAHVGMPRGVANFGQRAAAGQGVADERVAAVVDGERAEAVGAEDFAGGAESLAERVAG